MPVFLEGLIVFFSVIFGTLFFTWGFKKIMNDDTSKKDKGDK